MVPGAQPAVASELTWPAACAGLLHSCTVLWGPFLTLPLQPCLPQKGDLGCRALYGAPRTQPLNDYRLIYFVKKCLDAYIVSDCLPGELDLPLLLLLPSPPPLLGK